MAPVDAPTASQVQARIAEVEASAELDQAQQEALLAPLRSVLQSLEARDSALAERQRFLDLTAAAPGTINQLQQELDQAPRLPELQDFDLRPPDEALEAIRALLTEAQARLDAAQAEQSRLQTEAASREVRQAEGPTQLVQWRENLTEATTALAAMPQDLANPADQVRRWQQQAEAAELAARIARLEAELASYAARRELLPLRRSLAQRKASTASTAIEALRDLETKAANRKARLAQQQAERQAGQVEDPRLQALAEATSDLAERRLGADGTLALLESVRTEAAEAESALIELRRRARNTAARVQAAGLTEIVGDSLRQELRRLRDVDTDAQELLKDRMGRAQLELINMEDRLAEFGDAQAAIEQFRRRLAPDDQPVSPRIEQQINSIVTNYVEMLRSLESEYRDYYDEALDLQTTRATLVDTTNQFREFIEERILWTRSVQGTLVPDLDSLVRGGVWLLGGDSQVQETVTEGIIDDQADRGDRVILGQRWLEAIGDLWPPLFTTIPVLIALLASFWLRRYAIQSLKRAAADVRRFSSDRITLTLTALPLTLLLGLPVTLSLVLAGLLLEGTSPDVAQAVGSGLLETALMIFGLESIRHISRPDGLAESHFRWRREGLVHLRRVVFLLEIVLAPLAVIAHAFAEQGSALLNDAFGRLTFIAAQLVLAVFIGWIFAPWLPFMRSHLVKRPGSMASQLRWLWYPVVVLSPLAMGVLAALGYYYTAAQISQRLYLTTWLLVAILIAYSMVLRWLFIERRRLLVQRAQQKREAEQAEHQTSGGGEVEGIEFETPAELDAAEVDVQTRRVLSAIVLVGVVVGVYSLWTQQLPALRMLDRVQLYPQVDFIDSETQATSNSVPINTDSLVASDGDSAASNAQPDPTLPFDLGASDSESEGVRAITLADIGAALIFFVLTYILARNLPGLLEITLLKRLPLDAGARFAVTSILRYFIGIVGIVLGFGAIGIGWSQVQFLAAALTFGLAFGLQEIFANFISGLIILVERPVRVGDTVTVSGVDGRVTRIRMRATTVLDWELRELVIPNKVFITDHFINWTLSDPRIRVTVPVGVSYGSDVRLVQRTLLEIGQGYEHAVAEPRVRSLFMGFGDSTLDFQLRVYIEHFDYYIDAKSILHMRIIERFRELDIEIAFPQRDLNVRDIGPLADVLTQPKGDSELTRASAEDKP